MTFREFSGKNVEEAIRTAMKEFASDLSDLDIEILSQGSRGILGVGGEEARILAAPKSAVASAPSVRSAAPPAPEPTTQAPDEDTATEAAAPSPAPRGRGRGRTARIISISGLAPGYAAGSTGRSATVTYFVSSTKRANSAFVTVHASIRNAPTVVSRTGASSG